LGRKVTVILLDTWTMCLRFPWESNALPGSERKLQTCADRELDERVGRDMVTIIPLSRRNLKSNEYSPLGLSSTAIPRATPAVWMLPSGLSFELNGIVPTRIQPSEPVPQSTVIEWVRKRYTKRAAQRNFSENDATLKVSELSSNIILFSPPQVWLSSCSLERVYVCVDVFGLDAMHLCWQNLCRRRSLVLLKLEHPCNERCPFLWLLRVSHQDHSISCSWS